MNIIDGKIEIVTKISKIPEPFNESNNEKSFLINNNNYSIKVSFPNKTFTRMQENASKFESWICAINGKIKNIEENIIELSEPTFQVFENKKKK
ncbi:hypothetical protein [Silvanigrella aquatica]|uniref:Uncharacterized protein n=1 Tax=Silvanigrella aquatica TaxID=1915309 RepID=A0A1L4D4Z8_9BACT|nr:hypothetical protein [Silvanigrella aquatica]APJ05274.1 hypothetical protein AXG55_14730 [Silvanigrella aquatica]